MSLHPGVLHARSFCLLTFALPPLAALALPTAVHAAPAVHGREAEQVAGVMKLKGGLWHPYRRRWANERKHLPLVDVGETGGWKDLMTLMNCYQQADEASMLAVMESPIKLSGRLKEAAPESQRLRRARNDSRNGSSGRKNKQAPHH